MAKCPYCGRYFDKKSKAVEHIESNHMDMIGEMTPDQALYYGTHGTISGICMCGCGRPTEWNYKTGKPFKLTSDPACKERVFKKADENYRRVHGEARKVTLATNMDVQKEMQSHRPSAGKYRFKDGGVVSYLSKLEENFLAFCDKILEIPSRMVLDCPFTFHYTDGDMIRTYMPDYWMPDYNLLIEIKEGGKHPNTNPAYIKETKYKERLKDEVMKSQTEYNYIKIVDKTYGPFMETLFNIVENKKNTANPKKNAVIVITEDANMVDDIPTITEGSYPGLNVLICRDPAGMNMFSRMAIAESPSLAKIYIGKGDEITETTLTDDIFDSNDISIYKFVGDKDIETEILNHIIGESNTHLETISGMNRLFDIITECGAYYHFDKQLTNNSHRRTDFVKVGTFSARYKE